jgi:hypothetical protein
VGPPRSLVSVPFFCELCKKQVRFLPIPFAVALTGRSRSTVYNWMERGWVHWLELPNGRKVICEESMRPRRANLNKLLTESEKDIPKPPHSVQ